MDEKGLRFISRVYDAAIRPEEWETVLDEFCKVVDARAATLQVLDPRYNENRCNAASTWYRNPQMAKKVEAYFREIWHLEKDAYANLHRRVGEGFIPEYVSLGLHPEELHSHVPSRWVADNLGVFYRLGCRLNDTSVWQDQLSFHYAVGRSFASSDEISYANSFVPHLAKAVEVGRVFRVLRARFNAVLSALDHYRIATFITLQSGELVVENSEAKRILEHGDGLVKRSNGQLDTVRGEGEELRAHITQVSATACAEGIDAERIMIIARRSGAEPYLVSICPLRDPDCDIDARFRGAIVYALDPENTSVISTNGLAKLYGLTRSEATVCALLVDGMSTEDVAELRSVTVETVRSQVKSLMRKTRTNARIELIKLALSANLPIDPPAMK